ncbi:MAG TPA: PAS domain S-box protein [Methanoregulaceae archaeon]|nr:PAS domain S-box protein [Methanoregulaceae archaeon]
MDVLDQVKVEKIKQTLKWHPRGLTISDLSSKIKINRNLVAKYLDMLLISGQVEVKVYGNARVFMLSESIPMSAMLEFSSDMVIALDGEQRILKVNEQLLNLFGETRENLLGKTPRETGNPLLSAIAIHDISGEKHAFEKQGSDLSVCIGDTLWYFRVKQVPTIFEDGSKGITLIIEDISHQMKYQEQLKINEARYRAIVEDQTEFITRFLPDETLTFVNDSYARYLTMKPEDLVGTYHIPGILAKDKEIVRSILSVLNTTNPTASFECRVTCPGGEIRWLQWKVRVITGENGSVKEYQGVGNDITERMATTAKIKKYIADMEYLNRTAMSFMDMDAEADIYRFIASQVHLLSPDVIVAVTSMDEAAGTVTFRCIEGLDEEIHRTILEMGVKTIGKSFPLENDPSVKAILSEKSITEGPGLYYLFFKIFPSDLCSRIEEMIGFGKSYARGFVYEGVVFGSVVLIVKKGQELKNEEIIDAFLNQASIALLNRHTRDALAESEKKYRTVIDNIQDVFYRSDLNGNLIMASPSWATILGYDTIAECMGCSIANKFYMEPCRREEFLDAVNKDGFVRDYGVVLKKKDGSPLFVSTNSHLYYDESGSPAGVEGVFRDVTEQRAAQTRISEYIERIEFFSRRLQEYMSLPHDADIFEKIATDLRRILPEAGIAVRSFDPSQREATIRCWLFGKDGMEEFVRLSDQELLNLAVPVNGDALMELNKGRLIPLSGTLQEFLKGVVPEDSGRKPDDRRNSGNVYGVGFAREGVVLGDAIIFLPRESKIPDADLLETYARLAAIALQRYSAETDLKENREIFSSIAENSPFPIAIIDQSGKYHYINRSFRTVFGYDLEDFNNGSQWFRLAYPDPEYRRYVISTWISDLQGAGPGEVRPRTFCVRCKDGTPKDIIFRPVTLSDGKQCIVYEDVTNRNKAEKDQQLLSSIIESTDDAIIGKKTDGTIIQWNRAAESLYGYRAEEVIGRHVSIIVPPEGADELRAMLEWIRTGKSISNFQTRRLRKDGTRIDVAVTISPIRDFSGNVVGASTIARDITSRIAEERLKDEEEKYRKLVEDLNIGIYRSTGDPAGRFIWGNPGLIDILGFKSLDELKSQQIIEIFSNPEGREELLEELRDKKFVKNRVIHLKKRDGTPITVMVTALAEFDDAMNLVFINGIVQDITGA